MGWFNEALGLGCCVELIGDVLCRATSLVQTPYVLIYVLLLRSLLVLLRLLLILLLQFTDLSPSGSENFQDTRGGVLPKGVARGAACCIFLPTRYARVYTNLTIQTTAPFNNNNNDNIYYNYCNMISTSLFTAFSLWDVISPSSPVQGKEEVKREEDEVAEGM